MHKISLLLILILGGFLAAQGQTIYYVDVTRANNSGVGTSWATAKKDLQAAINVAISGDQVWVKAGTYLPTLDPFANAAPANNRNKTFSMKSGVSVYGGFAGTETLLSQRNPQANSTILSGDLGVANTLSDNAYHVVLVVNNTGNTLDGFIITKGYATAPSTASLTVGTRFLESFKGGGLFNSNSSTTFNDCIIRGNSADCTDNNDDAFGAGMMNDNCTSAFTNCTFDGNSFLIGGSSFGVRGAGVFVVSGACSFTRCAFINNTSGSGFIAGSLGGAVYIESTASSFMNCVFYNNSAQNAPGIAAQGAGSNTSTVTNCTFAGNTGSYPGVSFQGFAKMVLRNSIFWNTSPTISTIPGRDEIYSEETMVVNQPTFINCIIRDAGGSPLAVTNTTLTACLNNYPLFNNLSDGDGADNLIMTSDDGLRLQCISPAIGAGTGVTPTVDILNLPRSGAIDLGAYEGGHLDGSSNTIPAANTTVQLTQNAAGITNYSDCVNQLAQLQSGGSYTVSGPVTARVWVEGAQPGSFVKRHYEITPQLNASSVSGRVTLYFTQAEFNAFNAVNAVKLPTGPADAPGIANILVEKRAGTSNNGTGLPATYTGAIQTISNGAISKVWNVIAARWEISFDVNGFGGFFLKTQLTTLPIKRLDISIALTGLCNLLEWKTVDETDTKEFIIEKTRDGLQFNSVSSVSAIGSGSNYYKFKDCSEDSGKVFYRIKIIDNNNSYYFSTIVRAVSKQGVILNLHPNPVTDQVLISFKTQSLRNTYVKLTDAVGRVLKTELITGRSHLLNCKSLVSGIYHLYFVNGEVATFIKQ